MTNPDVVLSYGLGVDSTAVLLRWLLEPASRDFDLSRLVVVTAMTGDEWPQTGLDVAEHVLPLLRTHGVRFVQAARGRARVSAAGAGMTVLDDSRAPTEVFLAGDYKLSEEMAVIGTIPQSGGRRACSMHAKGEVLDPLIAELTGGRSFRHAVGFEVDELSRVRRDRQYGSAQRQPVYPLVEWGWDRAACLAYIHAQTGVVWSKSACTMCPFAFGSAAGRERTLALYAKHPDVAARTLMMEHTALSLNPAQGLIAGARLIDLVRSRGMREALAAFAAELAAAEWAVYEVRRINRPSRDDPLRYGNSARAVMRRTAGLSQEGALRDLRGQGPIDGSDDVARVWLRRAGEQLPSVAHFFAAAPTSVQDKQQPNFDDWWEDALLRVAAQPRPDVQLAFL